MPASRHSTVDGLLLTIDNGRYNSVKKVWECTAAGLSCSCKKHQGVVLTPCNHTYKNKAELRGHHESHHGPGTGLQCRHDCGHEAFQNRSNLRRHERTCVGAPASAKFRCPACDAEQARSDNFKRHLITTHQYTAADAQAVLQTLRAARSQNSRSVSSQDQTVQRTPTVLSTPDEWVTYPPIPDFNMGDNNMDLEGTGFGDQSTDLNNISSSNTTTTTVGEVAPDVWMGAEAPSQKEVIPDLVTTAGYAPAETFDYANFDMYPSGLDLSGPLSAAPLDPDWPWVDLLQYDFST